MIITRNIVRPILITSHKHIREFVRRGIFSLRVAISKWRSFKQYTQKCEKLMTTNAAHYQKTETVKIVLATAVNNNLQSKKI